MRSWWGKPSPKEVKQKTTRGSFFDALMHRKFKSGSEDKKTAMSGGVPNGIPSEKGSTLSVSISPSLEVSRCHSFAEESRAQPLPLPVQLSSVENANSDIRTSSRELLISPVSGVYDRRKPDAAGTWEDLEIASVSTNSSMDTNDQTDSRLFSPQASDYESGNVTAINSPSRLREHPPLVVRRQLKDQRKPLNQSSNNTLRRRRPLSSHVTKLQIPPHAGFIRASGNSVSCPSRSPVRTSAQYQVNKSDSRVRRTCSDNSIGNELFIRPGSGQNLEHDPVGDMHLLSPQNGCSAECSPILSPKMTSPGCRSLMQSGCVTPLHHSAGPKSHKLPLPPVSLSSYFPKSRGQGESSTSPVSRWKKGRMIGSGTFGHVYLGFNSETGEMCAMKEVTLFSDDTKSKECAQQLGQEVALLSRLRHPNILQYYGSEMVENNLYIYLEYISGGSIHKLLGDYGQFGESAIRSFTRQILSGLAYLHARNTVHRDIKGANILVDPNGRVKLADFGMAKHITGHSGPLSFKGSPYWMAPEVIRNSDGSNIAVDIWSLGCTIIEMATAKPPWSQYEGVAALFKVGNSKEIPAIPDHLSKEGKDFVLKCLQRNPLDRPTAAQLLDHPFVKNVSPSGIYLLNSEGSGYVNKVAGLDLEGVAERLPKGLKFASKSRGPSKHLSCPVSPISSPLRSPKSSQKTCTKRPPFNSNPRTASSSSAHIDCPKIQKSLYDAPVNHRSRQETSIGTPEISRANQGTSKCQSNLTGCQIMHLVNGTQESFNRQTRIKLKSSFVRPLTY
ncbi:mitogen-activated protein kinase kinase kinase YODA-like [Silene latifolia]|uniref:mitogen-activated protein kinase kinase kinase YODA-like n=1 Tax=Silene latifolia TaxID=37657 RepID=UPI003D78AD4F